MMTENDSKGIASNSIVPTEPSRLLEIDNVTQVFQPSPKKPPFVALKNVSLTIPGGEFVSIVGPTGCGKSTTLSAISGLRLPTHGQVRIGGDVVRGVRRDVGFVFQQDALLPWRTALENVELALKFRQVPRKEARERAREWLARVGLGRFESSYPHQLSGGMRKRTAIAATLVYEPSVLLMDEPFSSLDVQTRNLMENDLLHVWENVGHQTVVFVTHDLEEAIGLSDRVIVLTAGPGRVLGDYKVDLPRPRNLLDVKLDAGFVELYRKIWADLEVEVLKANEKNAFTSLGGH
jgi:NitT/TauT family transport system ATP-binding protein